MKKINILCTLALLTLSFQNSAQASDKGSWYLKAYGGVSILSDQGFSQNGLSSEGVTGNLEASGGMRLGGGAGYFLLDNVSLELTWDYSTNDSSVLLSDDTEYEKGDYASNIFFLNGLYHFNNLLPKSAVLYTGLGLGYIQEIDADLIASGVESSFSGSGDFVFQLMVGAMYPLTDKFSLHLDATYMTVSDIKLESEINTDEITNIDYNPVNIMFGVSYRLN